MHRLLTWIIPLLSLDEENCYKDTNIQMLNDSWNKTDRLMPKSTAYHKSIKAQIAISSVVHGQNSSRSAYSSGR